MRKKINPTPAPVSEVTSNDTTTSIRVTPKTKNALKAIASIKDIPMFQLVNEMLAGPLEEGLKEVQAMLGNIKPSNRKAKS